MNIDKDTKDKVKPYGSYKFFAIDIGLIRLKVLAFIKMEFPVEFVWFV